MFWVGRLHSMTRTGAWWLIPTAVVAFGCPPAPQPVVDAGVDAGVSVGPIELCSRISTASCDLKLRCYPAFTRLSRAECIDQAQADCLAQYEVLRPSFEASRVSVNLGQLDSCERRLTSSACPPSFPPDYPLAVVQPFSDCGLQTGLLTGAVPVGEICDQVVECVPGTFCVKPSGVCRGTCVTYSKLDEPCGIGCVAGLRCDGIRCTYPKGIDELCQGSSECEPDLICLGSCRPRRKLGETCKVDYERLSPCEPGLACDVMPFVDLEEGKCVVPGDAFADCRFHWSCRAGLVCADLNYRAFPNFAPAAGQCRAPDVEQSNCPQTQYARFVGDQCAPGLSCRETSNQCESLPQRGQACTPSKQDCSGFQVYCKPSAGGDVGVCTGPAAQGELCAYRVDSSKIVSIPCSSGFCEKEVTLQCRPPSRTTGSLCKEDGECISGRCVPQPDRTLKCAPPC